MNNQLLCYDPNTQKWTTPQCFGDVPSPRLGHASTISKNKVWLFGGIGSTQNFNDLFELTMHSLAWTGIQTLQSGPQVCKFGTLTALTEDQLVLYGGRDRREHMEDTWIMDLQSYSWQLYTSGKDHSRWYHTGSPGLNSSVIIIGGQKDPHDRSEVYNNVFHVALEPSLLQQLAMQIIYKYRAKLPWQFLPVKLISLLGLCKRKR